MLSTKIALLLTLSLVATSFSSAKNLLKTSTSKGVLLVANKKDQTLSLIDPVAGKELATVAEEAVTGHEVAASADGRTAYVPIYGDSGVGRAGTDGRDILVIDIASRKVTGKIDFGHGVRPHCAVYEPKKNLLYVTTELDKTVSVIDPRTLKVLYSIPTGQTESHMLTITRDGRRGYTANVGPGTVSVLDLEARKTLAVIEVSPTIQRVSLSADDRYAFTTDQTKPRVAVIDTTANRVKTWIDLPSIGFSSATTGDGRWLIVTMPKVNKVAAINLRTMKVEHLIDVPSTPQAVIVRPDNAEAYISCDQSHKIAVINLSDWKASKLIDAGQGADGLAWAPISE